MSEYHENVNLIDKCNGVGLGEEKRLLTSEKMFYELSYNNQTVHQSILDMEPDNHHPNNTSPTRESITSRLRRWFNNEKYSW